MSVTLGLVADLDDFKPPGADQGHPRQRWLAALATKQHGVVARWQLEKLGFSRHEIAGLLVRGFLHPLHRGVYAVGHTRLTEKGRWMAAVLACGRDAVLSHRAAVALWELRPRSSGRVDVTVPGRGRKQRRGIRVHCVRALPEADRARVDEIPVTSVHRTLLDHAEIARPQQVRLAIEAADRRELFDLTEMEELLARARGRRGLKLLRGTLREIRGSAPWTQSELERRFLALVRSAGLPEPSTNVLIEGELVDCFWPDARLVVEVDGYEFHKSRAQFEADRRRDAKLMLAGYRVLRVTQPRVEFDSRELVSDLWTLLSSGPAAEAAGP